MLYVNKELEQYINSPTEYDTDGNLVCNGHTIMYQYELPLMRYIADTIVHRGGSVLNIGYGLGFFDKRVEEIGVRTHTIMECHPNVVASIDIPTATIYVGPWQEHIGTLIENGQKYDCIFFDTFTFSNPGLYDEQYKFLNYCTSLLNNRGKVSLFTWPLHGQNITPKLEESLVDLKLTKEIFRVDERDYDYEHLYWEKEDEKEYGNEQNGYDVEKGIKEDR